MAGHPVTDPNSGFSFDNWLRHGGDRSIKRFIAGASYQRIGWVYAAVNAIARTIGGTPLQFKEQDENGDLKVIVDQSHPVNVLFNPPDGKALPSIDQLLFRQFVHLGIDGGVFYVLMKDRGAENFTRVTTKRFAQMKPVKNTDGTLLGWVELDKQMRTVAAFRRDEVIPFFYYNPADEMKPLSPLSAARLSLESEFNMNAWNAAFFKQGLRNPIAIKLKRSLTPTQEKEWEKRIKKFYGGIDQAQAAIMIAGGAEVQDLPMPTKDIEFIEGKKLNREEILAIYGVPPATVGIFEFANYANSREQQKILYQQTIIPHANWTADIINQTILQSFFPGVVAEFDFSGVEALQKDPTQVANSAKVYFDMGYNREEIANILNVPKLAERIESSDDDEGGEEPPPGEEEPDEETPMDGDEEFVQITPQTLNAAEWNVRQQGTEAWWLTYGRAHEAMMQQEENKLARGIRRYLGNARQMLNRKAQRREPVQLSAVVWTDNWSNAMDLQIERVMMLAASVSVLELANPLKGFPGYHARAVTLSNYMNPQEITAFEDAIRIFVNRITRVGQDLINEVNARLTEQLTSGQTIAQIQRTINGVIEETILGRATTIARTTANAAYNNSKYTLFNIKGVQTHRWVNAGDNFVRETHMSEGGNETEVGQPFPVTSLLHPLDPNGPPQEVINCRCTTVAVTKRTPGQPLTPRPEQISDGSNLAGLQTVSLQTQMSELFAPLTRGRKRFKDVGDPPSIDSVSAINWGANVLEQGDAWRAVSGALDNIPIKASQNIISKPKWTTGTPALYSRNELTKAGRDRLARHLQRPLPATVRERLPRVNIQGDARRTRAAYDMGGKTIQLTADQLKVLIQFMNDPLDYVANGGDPRQVFKVMRTVTHEYGHHVQDKTPNLKRWAANFFRERTVRKGQRTLAPIRGGRRSAERALPDFLHNRYQGRVYDWEIGPAPGQTGPQMGKVQGTEVIPMFYERMNLLPLDDWWLDLINQQPALRQIWQESLSKLFLVDPDGAKDFMTQLFGEF